MLKTISILTVTVSLSACCLQKSEAPKLHEEALKPVVDVVPDVDITSIPYDAYWARAAIVALLAGAGCAAYFIWKKRQ